MIISDKGNVKLVGSKADLSAELGIVIRAMLDEEVIGRDELDHVIELATMSSEDLHKKAKEIIERDDFEEFMHNLISSVFDSVKE